MLLQEIALRSFVGIALSAIPAAMMRRDSVRYGAALSAAALVGFEFSGGHLPTAIAAAALLVYQLYLRFAMSSIRRVGATCLALGSFLAAQGAFLPARLAVWQESFRAKVHLGTMGIALAMLVVCIEMRLRRLTETLPADIEALKAAAKKKLDESGYPVP